MGALYMGASKYLRYVMKKDEYHLKHAFGRFAMNNILN
jgi:hypothetical protein